MKRLLSPTNIYNTRSKKIKISNNEYVSASSVYNYMINDPLTDFLILSNNSNSNNISISNNSNNNSNNISISNNISNSINNNITNRYTVF